MNEASISKRSLWRYVNRKIRRAVHYYHVLSIISILFDEMIKDLRQGKDIKIHNLGTLQLKQMKPRQYFDVRYRKMMSADGNKVLRMTLTPRLRKKLIQHLDLDKTLGKD
jgi:nucleoid DNA-binding protein